MGHISFCSTFSWYPIKAGLTWESQSVFWIRLDANRTHDFGHHHRHANLCTGTPSPGFLLLFKAVAAQDIGSVAGKKGDFDFTIVACWCSRLNLWAGRLESRSLSPECHNGMRVVDTFREQFQLTECIRSQKYHKQPTKGGVDCWIPKGICN